MKENQRSVDPAAQVLLKVAGQKNITTSFDRAEKLKPCPIGHQGACCKICHMGPCRLVGKEDEAEGVCGATLPVVTARNFARMVAAGTAAHSDHADAAAANGCCECDDGIRHKTISPQRA